MFRLMDGVRTVAYAGMGLLLVASASGPVVFAQQPQLSTVQADFIPGDRTLFYDDFSDMTADQSPARFKVRGGAPELRAGGGVTQLTATAAGVLMPNLTTLPKNFTYEVDTLLQVPKGWVSANLLLISKEKEALAWVVRVDPAGTLTTVLSTKVPKYEEFGRKSTKVPLSAVVRLGLWIQDGRLRVFVNGSKQLDINQVEIAPVDRIELRSDMAGVGNSIGYRTVRFAESVPDASQVLLSAGRYVSHGILFDSDSDHLKPESAPAIQAIARALQATPALALRIEGHTDNVGGDAHNLDLSKRRAAAVKGVLVSQFSIAEGRLTTAGLGATRPMGSNDTPAGRALNRRVEFVKQ